MEAGKVTDAPETHRNPSEIAPETGESGAASPWSLSGVPADALAWPVTRTRKVALTDLLARLRGSIFGDASNQVGNRPKEPGDKPKNAVPINVRPWTWEILPHVSDPRDSGPLTWLMERVAWAATLPDARYVLLAERRRRREESRSSRALVRFAAMFAGKPAGPPPWIAESRHGEDP